MVDLFTDTWEFTNEHNEIIPFGRVIDYENVGAPKPIFESDERSFGGTEVIQVRYREKIITVQLQIIAAGFGAARQEARTLMRKLFVPQHRRPKTGVLNHATTGPIIDRSIRCFYAGGLELEGDYYEGPTNLIFDLEFYAPYPYWYSPAIHKIRGTLEPRGLAPSFPLVFPVQWGISGSSVNLEVNYAGDAPTRSLIAVFRGPMEDPSISHLQSGLSLSLVGDIPLGTSLVVSMGGDPEVDTKKFTIYNQSTGIEDFSLLGPNFSRIWLEPGINNLQVRSAGAVAVTTELNWREEYLDG